MTLKFVNVNVLLIMISIQWVHVTHALMLKKKQQQLKIHQNNGRSTNNTFGIVSWGQLDAVSPQILK